MEDRRPLEPESVTVLVLAGGRGSRSAEPELPKVLQQLDHETKIIDIHLRGLEAEGFRNVSFLLGHKSERVIAHIEACRESYPLLKVNYFVDEVPLGTRSSVRNALGLLPSSDAFLLLLGDTVIFAPLSSYLDRWLDSGFEIGIFCHPNLHMQDSDRLGLDEAGRICSYVQKGSGEAMVRGLFQVAATGAMFFTRRAFEATAITEADITKALVKSSLENSGAVGLLTSHYFKDSGTPERLVSVQRDFRTGVGQRRGSRSRSAIFLDRDGTLFADQGTNRKSVATGEIDSRISKSIAKCNANGVPVFIVTNQPGVAKGEITVNDVLGVHNQITQDLGVFGALIDAVVFCPHHPEAGFDLEIRELKVNCECRKPRPGMLYQLAKDHGLRLETSILIGDRSADEVAAKDAGALFILASFDGSVGLHTSEALDIAFERVMHVGG